MRQFNEWLGLRVTRAVGNMWCAYAFAGLALWSLPDNVDSVGHFVQWLSTTFLQLVLLSVIMVGQTIDARAGQREATETHDWEAQELELLRRHFNEEN